MKVLFATHNKAKLDLYKRKFQKYDLEILSLDELCIDYEVEEDGDTSTENAIKKAQEYYNIACIPTIAVDDGLELDGVPSCLQPGTHAMLSN